MVRKLEWSAGVDGPSCFLSVRGNILLWVHSSMIQKVLRVDLAVIHIHAYVEAV